MLKSIHNFFIVLLITVSVIFFHNASAGTIESMSKDEKHINYASNIDCVVKISGKYEGNITFFASAVVIDPHWIITAAHVVKDASECYIISEDNKYCLETVIYHKDFQDDRFGFSDIAIGYSKEPIKIQFYPSLYDKNDEVNQIVCICGYGATGTFSTGANLVDGKKRAGSNFIDKIDRDLLICTPSSRSSRRNTDLEFLIASGDSGGGLFIDKKLAGVNSCVIASDKKPDSSYSDEAGHTRISKYRDWIINTMKRHTNHE